MFSPSDTTFAVSDEDTIAKCKWEAQPVQEKLAGLCMCCAADWRCVWTGSHARTGARAKLDEELKQSFTVQCDSWNRVQKYVKYKHKQPNPRCCVLLRKNFIEINSCCKTEQGGVWWKPAQTFTHEFACMGHVQGLDGPLSCISLWSALFVSEWTWFRPSTLRCLLNFNNKNLWHRLWLINYFGINRPVRGEGFRKQVPHVTEWVWEGGRG